MVHAAAQAQAALEKRSARPCAANATKALQGGQVGACKGRAVSSKHKARAHREGQATISPHAGDGEGGERALTTHLPCRGLAELVRRRGVAAPAERERVGSVTRQTARAIGLCRLRAHFGQDWHRACGSTGRGGRAYRPVAQLPSRAWSRWFFDEF